MNASTTSVPFPGIAWGQYPQRRAVDTRSDLGRRASRMTHGAVSHMTALAARISNVRANRFAQSVVGQIESHANRSRTELVLRLKAMAPLMSRDGLREHHLRITLGLLGELSRRELGQAPYKSQIIAVYIMLANRLAEMATGEGKTLAAGLAAAIGALAGSPVHLITANDYLVERDLSHMKPLFDALELSSAAILPMQSPVQRRAAYACDIVYSTARELAFDYLRDRLAAGNTDSSSTWLVSDGKASPPLLRGLCMAIIDEADSILLDEACTPLILAGPAQDPIHEAEFNAAMKIAQTLWAGRDYKVIAAYRRVQILPRARERIAAIAKRIGAPPMHSREREARVVTALSALHCYRAKRDYLIEDDKIVLIDGPTGRKADGRTWSRGLHQMIEIKEGLPTTPATETVAQITYQQFFARYLRLCGMSGSLVEARPELLDIYKLPIRVVPLRLRNRRRIHRTRVVQNPRRKWREIVRVAKLARDRGRAVLLAVDSVACAARLSRLLAGAGIAHRRLDAGEHAHEAEIIAHAGLPGSVTVATNMAGRGTDIKLTSDTLRAGGLLTIICHYNRERRIDRQMFGRAARQGQPGDVLRIVASTDLASIGIGRRPGRRLRRLCASLPAPLQDSALRTSFRAAQRLCELRQRRQRYRVLDAGRQRDRLLALAGSGE